MLTKPPVPAAGEAPVISPDAPKAALAAAISDFYLIVTSDPPNKIAPVKFQIVSANADHFKPGQQLWFNLTGNIIGSTLSSQQLLVKLNSRIISRQQNFIYRPGNFQIGIF